MTNREWLATLDNVKLSLFMTIGIPVHDLTYDFDIILGISNFRTPSELREWFEKPQKYEFGWKHYNIKENENDQI